VNAPAPSGASLAGGVKPARGSAADSGMTLKSGQEGTVFRTLTVEGEDRIHIDVERPALHMELDPEHAPGLDWGTARDVLDRTTPDLGAPLLALSARETSPYVARPWLSHFATGAVARFRPEVKGVERWKLTVANARGEAIATFQGRGDPPREIAWDGRSTGGGMVVPGMTYSYVFEAHDRAGNKRNFVGEGFQVAAWRLDTPAGPMLTFAGTELSAGLSGGAEGARAASADPPPVVLEAASWLNQSPRPAQTLRIESSARTLEEANRLASSVMTWLAPRLIGGAARMQVAPEVRADAPAGGVVRIAAAR
jgi:hypothetical protein